MKIGDTAICINATGVPHLTTGAEYEILPGSGAGFVVVENDIGIKVRVWSHRLVVLGKKLPLIEAIA